MRRFERLQDARSPYELNVLALQAFAAGAAITLLSLFILPEALLVLVLVPFCLTMMAVYALSIIGFCPSCSKSPMRMQAFPGKIGQILAVGLTWPETRCSGCGHDLTLRPEV